jgi:hypothetical protein
MYEARDLSPGQQMVECFKPFLRHLLSLRLSRKTLRQHRDNLWLLGGELILDLHEALGLERSRWTGSCLQPSMTKTDRSSPAERLKISNVPSTRPAESFIASSKTATPRTYRGAGRGQVDNASALPTCPPPQQKMQTPIAG